MKTLIHFSFLLLLFGACKETKETREALLPESAGQLAELVVVTDKSSLDSGYQDFIKGVFQEEVKAFPPPGEKQFKVLITDESFFKGYFKSHQNIFVLVTQENIEKLSEIVGLGNLKKAKDVLENHSDVLGFNRSNVWAQNQNVFYITGENQAVLKKKMLERKQEINDLAHRQEMQTAQKKFFILSEKSDSFFQKSLRNKGYAVRKPKSYRVAIDNPDFAWLRKSPSDKEQEFGILLFHVPYTSKEQLTTEGLIAIRNEFSKKYVPGSLEGSYMKYSSAITPAREEGNLNEQLVIEIRGWWDMAGDFMGGPSVMRAVVDDKNKRIVFAEGFLYFPNEKKSRSLRELELILNTLTIND